MATVHIEHAIRDYHSWKAAFDRDPAGREASGVRRYRVSRPIDDEHYVIIELDFDTRELADAFVTKMRAIWNRVEGDLMRGPQVRVLTRLEEHSY